MKTFYAIFCGILAAILLGGCLAKNAVKAEFYELSNIAQPGLNCAKMAKTPLFIERVDFVNTAQNRDIIFKQNGKISSLENAKFSSFPSVMIYRSVVDFFYQTCDFSPLLDSQNNALSLKIMIFDIFVTQNNAEISAFVTILRGGEDLANQKITASQNIENFSNQNAINALNIALEKLNFEIYNMLKSCV